MSEVRVENITGENGTDAVKFAPPPEKLVAVHTPDEILIPLEKLTAALPSSPFISVTLISDMFIEYFYLFS